MLRTEPDRGAASADEDAALMRRYADGDARAFETLYARHRGWLFRVIRRQIDDDGRAQEAFQEVWLSVVRNAADWRPEAKFTTWLYGIARSRIIDSWRSLKPDSALHPLNRHDDASGAGDDPATDDATLLDRALVQADPAATPLAAMAGFADPALLHEQREVGRRILAALATLPAAQREAFLLAVEAGMTLPEVANATGSTLEAAKSRLRYARARLASALQGWRP